MKGRGITCAPTMMVVLASSKVSIPSRSPLGTSANALSNEHTRSLRQGVCVSLHNREERGELAPAISAHEVPIASAHIVFTAGSVAGAGVSLTSIAMFVSG